MKVFVLGHRGMLGHVTASYLAENGVEVLTTEARYEAAPRDALVRAVSESAAEWVINAIGKIKQKTTEPAELFQANSLLPAHLKSFLRPEQRLIHASTDCVFSGKRGNYATDEQPDAEDVYGLSKLLGEAIAEPGRCQVVRTSIIGPELKSGAGLMGWFLAQREAVKGFTNHFWNGITTLEWAKISLEIMRGEVASPRPVLQAASAEPVTKFQLLEMIAEVWNHRIPIEPVESEPPVNRTLVPDLKRPPLREQIREQYAWYQSRRNR